jgi:hypothetical protein
VPLVDKFFSWSVLILGCVCVLAGLVLLSTAVVDFVRSPDTAPDVTPIANLVKEAIRNLVGGAIRNVIIVMAVLSVLMALPGIFFLVLRHRALKRFESTGNRGSGITTEELVSVVASGVAFALLGGLAGVFFTLNATACLAVLLGLYGLATAWLIVALSSAGAT